jgi:hypothetical protein
VVELVGKRNVFTAVTQKGTVQFGSGSLTTGGTVSIHTDITGVFQTTIDTAVVVQNMSLTSFTFRTVPGHVLFPATITFSAYDISPGNTVFGITVNGNFANVGARVQYNLGGSDLEDHIWKHLLGTAAADCQRSNIGVI